MAVNEIVIGLGEILADVKEAKSVGAKVALLQKHDSRGLRGF